jgi:hypothetical protein
MNFILFELAVELVTALKAIDDAAETGFPEALAQARIAIAKAESAGVTARLPATTTE